MKLLRLLLLAVPVILGSAVTVARAQSVPAAEPIECAAGTPHDADSHADHDHGASEASAQLAWRFVTHYGCGWTGHYLVNVPAYNTLQCFGCGWFFSCYIW